MWYSSDDKSYVFDRIRLHCPVCDTFLGIKNKGEIKSFDCLDCKATYTFYPGTTKRPKGTPHSLKPKICGCDRCGH